MRTRMGIGRCCCGGTQCDIAFDTFDRANSTDINTGSPCGWLEVSGNLSINSNGLIGDGAARCNIIHPDNAQPGFQPSGRFTGSCSSGAFGYPIRWCWNFLDASSYYCVEWNHQSNQIVKVKLISRQSSVDTVITSHQVELLSGETFTYCIDYAKNGNTIINFSSTSARIELSADVGPAGSYPQVAIVFPSPNGQAVVHDWYWTRSGQESPECATCQAGVSYLCGFQTWEIVDEVENLIDVIGLAKTGAVVTEEYRTHAIITLGAIPPAALIDYAYITFTGQDLRDVGTILRCDIFGHDIDYAATYPTYAQFAAAQRTTASIYWDTVEHDDSPPVFGEYAWITPNIKSIIQEIVDRPGYAMGNEMGLFFQPRGSTVGNDKTCVVRMNFGAFYVRWTP